MMTKQEQFLWIVQTTILANGITLTSLPSLAEKYRHDYSSVGAKNLMAEAIYASERIPEVMTAADAADDFCLWMLTNLRDIQEQAGKKMHVPAWFARD
jgi:hypothetical protein